MNKSRLMRLFRCGITFGLCVSCAAISGQFLVMAMGNLLLVAVVTGFELFGFYTDEMAEWRSRRPAIDSYCMQCRCHVSHCWRSHA